MLHGFGNSTRNNTIVWIPEPNSRGTWGLLSSCIITISLCVWTAVHLNIAEHRKADQQFWRKLKWLLLGLCAPELVAYLAWQQREEAKKVVNLVRKSRGQSAPQSWLGKMVRSSQSCSLKTKETSKISPSETCQDGRPEWTLVQGFYVVMGGFVMDCSKKPFLPGTATRAAITPEGLRFLLEYEPDFLPDISKEQIQDKSKADGIAKVLICAQALWFCLQCATRFAQSLPVSLLELNTIGHSLCTLLIYLMWWQKPLNVNEPTLIQDDRLRPLFAYMWMTSRISGHGYHDYDIRGATLNEFDRIWPYRSPDMAKIRSLSRSVAKSVVPSGVRDQHVRANVEGRDNSFSNIGGRQSPNQVTDGQAYEVLALNPSQLPAACLGVYDQGTDGWDWRHYPASSVRYRMTDWLVSHKVISWIGFRRPAGIGVRRTAIDHFSPSDLTRWTLALQALERYDIEMDFLTNIRKPLAVPRVKTRVENITYEFPRNNIWLGCAVAGCLYGGLHLLAWNAPFSSELEGILWRIAASSVTLTGIFFAPLILWTQSPLASRGFGGLLQRGHRGQAIRRRNESRFKIWGEIVLAALISFVMVPVVPSLSFLYVGSRVYLVVESFKNVAYLPAGAFQLPQWSSYVPHIA